MGLSRPAKIKILLAIDSAFFFVELIVGYAVGSLALVADSFHMLNDVLSLVVALYAIKLSASGASAKYSYGWHRAEILAALINGVFLLALCFSIFMEAIERFFSTPEISNPKLVVIVGSLGLASNILGLFLFHEHSHDHGDEKDHSKTLATPAAETTNTTKNPTVATIPTESTPLLIGSPTPDSEASTPRRRADSATSLYGHPAQTRAALVAAGQEAQRTQARPVKQRSKGVDDGFVRSAPVSGAFGGSRGISSRLEEGFGKATGSGTSDVDIVIHDSAAGDDEECEPCADDTEGPHAHTHPVTPYQADQAHTHDEHDSDHDHDHGKSKSHSHGHGHGHGHSHGSMNMRALVLHVMGDALGNVGVIATGLIIWLTTWSGKYYCDPVISLVITAIIFSSALPLVKSTSSILLQAVPPSLSLPHLRTALRKVPGVLAVHELHVWQLSEAKSVASVHVRVDHPMEFMTVAARVRGVLHAFGVHSSTIQPEYAEGSEGWRGEVEAAGLENEEGGEGCLVPCAVPGQKGCAPEDGCCPPVSRPRTP